MITIQENYIGFINISIVILYVLFFFKGARRGFLSQVINLVGTVLSFFAAWRYSSIGNTYFSLVPRSILPFQDTLLANDVYEIANRACWFFLLFLLCKILFYLLEKVFDGIQKIPVLKEISSLLGGLLGILSTTIWIIVFCTILKTPIFSNGWKIYKESWLSSINDMANKAVVTLGIPSESNDLINEIYVKTKDVPDDDKKAIVEWLRKQGYIEKSGN